MERFQEELEVGRRHLRTADHLISITYPLVMDHRLLLAAMENLYDAARSLMASLLHYEETFKRIPHFREEFDSMIYWFQSRCVPRYNFSRDYCDAMYEIKSLADNHKLSSVEFSRKDGFVMFSDASSFRKVPTSQLKSCTGVMKRLLLDVEGVVSRYEGVFGRSKGRAKAR